MSMSDGERGELVKLWGDLPGTMPESLDLIGPPSSIVIVWRHDFATAHETVVAALARDAVVEWITTHLMPDGDGVTLQRESNQDGSLTHLVCVPDQNWYDGPTRLLALIAAARAVGGKG